MSNPNGKAELTTHQLLGRKYSQDSWSIGGMLAILENIHDLWGVDVSAAQEAVREVKTQMTIVWKGIKP